MKYTTVSGFWKFLGIDEHILDFQVGLMPARETVSASGITAGVYYLDQLGVNEDNLNLYVGTGNTTLTGGSYSFDSDRSAITITADGATTLSGQSLTATYEYNQLGKGLTYNETVTLLNQAEADIEGKINTVFADQTATAPAYDAYENELHTGMGHKYDYYQLDHYPIVKLQTTTATGYVTGGSTLELTSSSGFPSSGTIYVGGNKVSYTAKSGNSITIPSDTPSVSSAAVVRGEVIEVSTSPEGVTPSFQVLIPDSDYAMDYDTGRVKLTDNYYNPNLSGLTRPQYGAANRFRATYLNAWHKPGVACEIPGELVHVINSEAARKLLQRTVFKANINQRDNFSGVNTELLKEAVDGFVEENKIIQVRNT